MLKLATIGLSFALATSPISNVSDETAPPMEHRLDSPSGLSVALAMAKKTYVVGDRITVYLDLQNPTDHDVSAFHLPGAVNLSRVDGSADDGGHWGFPLSRESRPTAISRAYGTLSPGASFRSVFQLAGPESIEQPGVYRVRVRVTILKSLTDHTPVAVVEPPPIEFSIVPK
jgi:hypothetical protein